MGDQQASFTTRIKVRVFNTDHVIVVDWNDSRVFKQSQIFDQLETITGVSKRHIIWLGIPINHSESNSSVAPFNPDVQRPLCHRIYNFEYISESLSIATVRFSERPLILNSYIEEGTTYILSYAPICYEDAAKHIFIKFFLLPENDVLAMACQSYKCLYLVDEKVFKVLKKVIANEELNAKIAESLESGEDRGTVYANLNVIQYLRWECILKTLEILHLIGPFPQTPPYIRVQG